MPKYGVVSITGKEQFIWKTVDNSVKTVDKRSVLGRTPLISVGGLFFRTPYVGGAKFISLVIFIEKCWIEVSNTFQFFSTEEHVKGRRKKPYIQDTKGLFPPHLPFLSSHRLVIHISTPPTTTTIKHIKKNMGIILPVDKFKKTFL
jgi:hypothetical protein